MRRKAVTNVEVRFEVSVALAPDTSAALSVARASHSVGERCAHRLTSFACSRGRRSGLRGACLLVIPYTLYARFYWYQP